MVKKSQNLGFLLSQIGAYIGIEFRQELQQLKITTGHAGILRLVSLSEKISQRQLARKLSINPSRLVILLDELQKMKLMMRTVDEKDRRNHNLNLTEEGDRMVKRVGNISRKLTDKLCRTLSLTERNTLEELLQKIATDQDLIPNVHPAFKANLE
ncbi:MAG: winged helix-turn-helix transcriptional regulator [Turneriella sp.]|nr:winged helix-turn-helix transcriptional regulator [Turneriella sp.]